MSSVKIITFIFKLKIVFKREIYKFLPRSTKLLRLISNTITITMIIFLILIIMRRKYSIRKSSCFVLLLKSSNLLGCCYPTRISTSQWIWWCLYSKNPIRTHSWWNNKLYVVGFKLICLSSLLLWPNHHIVVI